MADSNHCLERAKFRLPEIHIPTEQEYYDSIARNPNTFSNWFPKVKDCGLNIPETVIIPLTPTELMALFHEKCNDDEVLDNFITTKVLPVIPPEWGDFFFMKNGCFSNKFDFRSCVPRRNLESIKSCLLTISERSFCCDTDGQTELVCRRFIGDWDTSWRYDIYLGMRLRPEIRVFYDFDRKKVLYTANYWDWDYCKDMISAVPSDGRVFSKVAPKLRRRYNAVSPKVASLVESHFKDVTGLTGIWSVDMMWAERKWWLIDMAVGCRSAYWDWDKVKKLTTEK